MPAPAAGRLGLAGAADAAGAGIVIGLAPCMPAPAAGRVGLAGAADAAGAGIVIGLAPCMPAPAAGGVLWAQAGEAIASAAAIAKLFARFLGFIEFPPVGKNSTKVPQQIGNLGHPRIDRDQAEAFHTKRANNAALAPPPAILRPADTAGSATRRAQGTA